MSSVPARSQRLLKLSWVSVSADICFVKLGLTLIFAQCLGKYKDGDRGTMVGCILTRFCVDYAYRLDLRSAFVL